MQRIKIHQTMNTERPHSGIIGFDIDGVLTDEIVEGENIWQREIEAYFPELRLLEPSFSFTTAYGLSLDRVDEFMQERAPSIFRQVKPQAGCRELLGQLHKMGFVIHLITARQTCYEEITRQWLAKHDFGYKDLWFADDKGKLCQHLGVELFVDDYWENCLDVHNHGTRALLMTAPHNLRYQMKKGIYRVENWQEIAAHIGSYYRIRWEDAEEVSGA
ncbi:MAG: hypothetical protein GX998_08220 [Firmicutes bacterium]|nr:hypothetical protein [Bacillota bacterium]